jgi:hypothetical protein
MTRYDWLFAISMVWLGSLVAGIMVMLLRYI